MSVTVRGINEAKTFLVQAAENAKQKAAQSKTFAEEMGQLVTKTNDTNLHEIATSMNGVIDSVLTGVVQGKIVTLFEKYADTLQRFVSTNPQHKAEYGAAIQEIEDAVQSLKATDLEIGSIPAPDGGGEYSIEELNVLANLTADATISVISFATSLRDSYGEVKGQLIDELSNSLNAILEDLQDEVNNLSSSISASVEGIITNQQNMKMLAELFDGIGAQASGADSATAQAAGKAREVASEQSAMSID